MRLLPWLLIAVNVLKEKECDTEKCFVHLLYDEFLTRIPDFDHVPCYFLNLTIRDRMCRSENCFQIKHRSHSYERRQKFALYNIVISTGLIEADTTRWAYQNYIIFNETHCVIQMITICISKALYVKTSHAGPVITMNGNMRLVSSSYLSPFLEHLSQLPSLINSCSIK